MKKLKYEVPCSVGLVERLASDPFEPLFGRVNRWGAEE